MIGITLLATTVIALAAASILYAVATTDSALMPATVNPFSPPSVTDPTAETLAMNHHSAATLAGDWVTFECKTLGEVEDTLDWIENHDMKQTELEEQEGSFVVRCR